MVANTQKRLKKLEGFDAVSHDPLIVFIPDLSGESPQDTGYFICQFQNESLKTDSLDSAASIIRARSQNLVECVEFRIE